MNTKTVVPIVLLLVLASMFAGQFVFAQPNQTTSNVSLTYLNVQLTYPSEVLPGQTVTVSVVAQSKYTFQLYSLSLQVYLTNQNSLQQLLTTTVAQSQMVSNGGQITGTAQVAVPSNAPRTSLVAVVTESIASQDYYSYSYYSGYWNGYWGGYGNGYNNYPNRHGYGYPYYSGYYYPSYSYQSSSDSGIAPLSYVLATTPEYVSLQSQYQGLQQQLNQTQAQNQQLQQQLQAAQNSNAQKDSTISTLNSQLSSTQGTTTLVEVVAVILAIAVVALAVLHFKPEKTTTTPTEPTPKTAEKPTNT